MKERQAVVRELGKGYRQKTKKERGLIVDELVRLTSYNRAYACRALRDAGRTGRREPRSRSRRKTYGPEVLVPLRKIWATMDGIAGKRLAPFLPEMVAVMEREGELHLSPEVREKLLRISAATIDRLLGPDRRRLVIRGRSRTKPGTLLKHQIPIRTFASWDEGRPGFLEVDLVSHDGGRPVGDWIHTLSATDVASGWTETRACKNKAQVHVFAALLHIRRALPFPLLGLDSDNGSEFINDHLRRYCEQKKITFTRSRPYRKNDACFVEQKNWHVVRRTVGYVRYDTEEELTLLNELYSLLRLMTNFFSPQMKLREKTRDGARVTKRYDQAKTPYQRLLEASALTEKAEERLDGLYLSLNPAQLQRKIGGIQNRLRTLAVAKLDTMRKEAIGTEDLQYLLAEGAIPELEYILT
jgi:hypothetical protein